MYSVGSETVRRHEVIERLELFRSEGDMPRLWAAVRRAKLDVELSEKPTVNNMADIVAKATKYKLICENVARRVADTNFTTKDLRVLEKAFKEIEGLKVGPKVWKDPMYPYLAHVQALRPHLETLRQLVKEHRAGCANYCSAWLAMMDSLKLRSSMDLEVSTAKWLLAFPDSAEVLGGVVSDGVKLEYWRLVESIESTGSEPLRASKASELKPREAYLTNILVLAGSLTNTPVVRKREKPQKSPSSGTQDRKASN